MTARRTEALPVPTVAPAPRLPTEALIQRIYDLRNEGRQLDAEPLIAEVLNDPAHPARKAHNFWRALAIWSADAHHHESVRDAYREIIKMGPDMPQPWDEYTLALSSCGDWADAIEACKLGLNLCDVQKLPLAHSTRLSLSITRGALYLRQGQVSQAIKWWRSALEQRGDAPVTSQYALAQVKLILDHDAEAWRMHENRLTHVAAYQWEAAHMPSVRRWWPGLKGRVVFWQEQGAGDLIQMLRWIPKIAEASGEEVVVRCDPPLWSLVRAWPGVGAVVDRKDRVEADYELPILSAPLAFGVNGWKDVPPPVVPETFRWQVMTEDRPVIGLCWSGAKGHPNDADRSMPASWLDTLREKLQPGNYQYQALQPGDTPYWMAPLPQGDYAVTARTIQRCRAVFSVDTSIVHLAGTMGVPTVCVPPSGSEWRWGLAHTSTWYPDMRLVRRTNVTRWSLAIQMVADWLRPATGRPKSYTRVKMHGELNDATLIENAYGE